MCVKCGQTTITMHNEHGHICPLCNAYLAERAALLIELGWAVYFAKDDYDAAEYVESFTEEYTNMGIYIPSVD